MPLPILSMTGLSSISLQALSRLACFITSTSSSLLSSACTARNSSRRNLEDVDGRTRRCYAARVNLTAIVRASTSDSLVLPFFASPALFFLGISCLQVRPNRTFSRFSHFLTHDRTFELHQLDRRTSSPTKTRRQLRPKLARVEEATESGIGQHSFASDVAAFTGLSVSCGFRAPAPHATDQALCPPRQKLKAPASPS